MEQEEHPLVSRIDRALTSANLTRNAAERRAGLGQGFIRAIGRRGPASTIGLESLRKLADAIGCPVEELLDETSSTAPQARALMRLPPQGRPVSRSLDVPILGTANGSAIGAFQMTPGAIGYVPRPPGLAHVQDAYALYVRNDSMSPKHAQGDLVFVHPHKPPKPGDSVIIQVTTPNRQPEAYIKIFTKNATDWLVAQQINPAAELKFAVNTVAAVHKVLTTAELFNA